MGVNITPAGAPQTPWAQDIDAAGFAVQNGGQFRIENLAAVGGLFAVNGDGSANFSSGLNSFAADGTVDLADGHLHVDTDGSVRMDNLPTSDPHVAGQLWSNLGIITISTG